MLASSLFGVSRREVPLRRLQVPEIDNFDGEVAVQRDVIGVLEEWRLLRVRVKAAQLTVSDEGQAVVGAEGEEARLLVLGGTHDSNGLGHHQLVRAMGVEVNAGEEGGLGGVGMYPANSDEVQLVLVVKQLLLLLSGARVSCPALLRDQEVCYEELALGHVSSQHSTSLHIPRRVAVRQGHEIGHKLGRHPHLTQPPAPGTKQRHWLAAPVHLRHSWRHRLEVTRGDVG